jgi:hypothetical protein
MVFNRGGGLYHSFYGHIVYNYTICGLGGEINILYNISRIYSSALAGGLLGFEGGADAVGSGERGVYFGEGVGGVVKSKAEGHESFESFVGGSFDWVLSVFRGAAVTGGEADFVFEVNDSALGGFLPYSGGFADETGIGACEGIADIFGGGKRENGHGGFRADALDGNQEFEESFAGEGGKAKELFGLLANVMISVNLGSVAEVEIFKIQSSDSYFIADASNVDDDRV